MKLLKNISRKNFKSFINKHFFDSSESMRRKALSIAFGVFMSIFPVWGFQLLIGVSLSHVLRLNKALFIVAAMLSNPPTVPIILWGSYRVGGWMVAEPKNDLLLSNGVTLDAVKENFVQYLVGAVALSFAMGILAGLITYGYLYYIRSRKAAFMERV